MSHNYLHDAFATVLASNNSAVKLNAAKILGGAALKAVFDNPTVRDSVLVAGSMLSIAGLSDEETAHGKLLRDVAFGMSLHAADEVLRKCDEEGAWEAEATPTTFGDTKAVITEVFKSEALKSVLGDDTKPVRFSKQNQTKSVAQVEPKNAKANTVEEPKPMVKVISGPEVANKIDLVPVKPTEVTKEDLFCAYPGCGIKLVKAKDRKQYHAPQDEYATEQMKTLDGSYVCKIHQKALKDSYDKNKAAARREQERETKRAGYVEELTNLTAEMAEENKALAASEAAVNKLPEGPIKEAGTKELEKMRQSKQAKTKRITWLENTLTQMAAAAKKN